MEMTLNNNFINLSSEQLEILTGGGLKSVFYAAAGSILIANSLAIGVICTPAGGVGALGSGLYLLGCAF